MSIYNKTIYEFFHLFFISAYMRRNNRNKKINLVTFSDKMAVKKTGAKYMKKTPD